MSYGSYTLQAKISKRGRKLIDYDGARHNYDAMTAKKVDQAKLSKVGLFSTCMTVIMNTGECNVLVCSR